MFNEVDSVLNEIRRCYMELDKFWAEEIHRAIEALKLRRVDPTDLERWENFNADLKDTARFWNVQYSLFFLRRTSLTDQNTLFRLSNQVVVLQPYTATMHARLRFARFSFHFGSL